MSRAEYLKVVRPVVRYFEDQGLPVIARRDKHDVKSAWILQGKDEFGTSLEGSEFTQLDVLAFSWNSDSPITTKAVECKLADSPGKSIELVLGQAARQRFLFDQVYVAVQSGEIGNRQSMLSDLGLGWISVDESGSVDIRRNPEHKRSFDRDRYNKQVLPRLALPLTFLDSFGPPIRYGETRRGGIWVAKELTKDPGLHVQMSGWFDQREQSSFLGLNIEHKETFRRILQQHLDLAKVSLMLKELDSCRYEIRLQKDLTPKARNAQDIPIELKNRTDAKELLDKIDGLLQERRFRPHFFIVRRFVTGRDLKRDQVYHQVEEVSADLKSLITYLKEISEKHDA